MLAIEQLTIGSMVNALKAQDRITDFREVFVQSLVGFEFALNLLERALGMRFRGADEADEFPPAVEQCPQELDFDPGILARPARPGDDVLAAAVRCLLKDRNPLAMEAR